MLRDRGTPGVAPPAANRDAGREAKRQPNPLTHTHTHTLTLQLHALCKQRVMLIRFQCTQDSNWQPQERLQSTHSSSSLAMATSNVTSCKTRIIQCKPKCYAAKTNLFELRLVQVTEKSSTPPLARFENLCQRGSVTNHILVQNAGTTCANRCCTAKLRHPKQKKNQGAGR